jgi:hypothetical protein
LKHPLWDLLTNEKWQWYETHDIHSKLAIQQTCQLDNVSSFLHQIWMCLYIQHFLKSSEFLLPIVLVLLADVCKLLLQEVSTAAAAMNKDAETLRATRQVKP